MCARIVPSQFALRQRWCPRLEVRLSLSPSLSPSRRTLLPLWLLPLLQLLPPQRLPPLLQLLLPLRPQLLQQLLPRRQRQLPLLLQPPQLKRPSIRLALVGTICASRRSPMSATKLNCFWHRLRPSDPRWNVSWLLWSKCSKDKIKGKKNSFIGKTFNTSYDNNHKAGCQALTLPCACRVIEPAW